MDGAPRHKHHMKISEVAQCIHSYTSVQNCSLGLFPAFMELLIANMPSKSKRKIYLEAASATKWMRAPPQVVQTNTISDGK